jgi:hypothetical protein
VSRVAELKVEDFSVSAHQTSLTLKLKLRLRMPAALSLMLLVMNAPQAQAACR